MLVPSHHHSASGRVYEDSTGKGTKGVAVYLVDITSKGTTRKSVTTDVLGDYSFNNIHPGTYVVRIAEVAKSMSGLDNTGSPPRNLLTQRIIAVCNGEDHMGLRFGCHRLEEDVYSLLFFAEDIDISNASIAYFFIFAIFFIQILLLVIVLNKAQYNSFEQSTWPIPLPRIHVPVLASRFLVYLVVAAFQSDIIALIRLLFVGYGVVFPQGTSIRRVDNFIFVLACTSRFVIKAICLLISLIIIIYNDNVFDLVSNFLTMALITTLHKIVFTLLLLLLVSLNIWSVLSIWKLKAIETKKNEYLKMGERAIVMRSLEFMFILSAIMPGMWG